jgi:hypothetical protein
MKNNANALDIFWCSACGNLKGFLRTDARTSILCDCDEVMKSVYVQVNETNMFGELIGDDVRFDVI